MFTYVGDDLYDENIKNYPEKLSREESENFLKIMQALLNINF